MIGLFATLVLLGAPQSAQPQTQAEWAPVARSEALFSHALLADLNRCKQALREESWSLRDLASVERLDGKSQSLWRIQDSEGQLRVEIERRVLVIDPSRDTSDRERLAPLRHTVLEMNGDSGRLEPFAPDSRGNVYAWIGRRACVFYSPERDQLTAIRLEASRP